MRLSPVTGSEMEGAVYKHQREASSCSGQPQLTARKEMERLQSYNLMELSSTNFINKKIDPPLEFPEEIPPCGHVGTHVRFLTYRTITNCVVRSC